MNALGFGDAGDESFEPVEEYRPKNRISEFLPDYDQIDDHPVAVAETVITVFEALQQLGEVSFALRSLASDIRRVVSNASGIEWDESEAVFSKLDFLPADAQAEVRQLRTLLNGLFSDYNLTQERLKLGRDVLSVLETRDWSGFGNAQKSSS